jgi:hypothetical protein
LPLGEGVHDLKGVVADAANPMASLAAGAGGRRGAVDEDVEEAVVVKVAKEELRGGGELDARRGAGGELRVGLAEPAVRVRAVS